MLQRIRLQRLIGWLLLLAVAGGGFLLVADVYGNYMGVARAFDQAYAVRPVFVSAEYVTEPGAVNVAISFRIDTGDARVPLYFDALAYTLVVLDPAGDTVTEGRNAVQGVYIGRYSYWGGEQRLKVGTDRVFRSPSTMHSLYKDRLKKELAAGHRTLVAMGELTLEVMTKFGRQTVAIPFLWRFSLEVAGG